MRAIKPLRSISALLVALVLSLGLAGQAQAAPAAAAVPVGVSAAQVGVPQMDQYGRRFVISLNCQVVTRGVTCTLTITFARSGESISIVLFSDPTPLGTVTADANGTAQLSFSTAGLSLGEHRVTATGDGGYTQEVSFTVVAEGANPALPAGSAGGASGLPATASRGGLAFTGSNAIIPLATIGAILVLAGGGAVVASRRRREV